MSKATIIRGEDRILILRLVFEQSQEPFDLTGFTKITVQFKKHPSGFVELDSDLQGTANAQFTYEGVTYLADNFGAAGNAIQVIFTGSNTILQAITTWNNANPSNTVSSDAADDSVIPSAATVNLADGNDGFRDVEVLSEILGKIQVVMDEDDTSQMRVGKGVSFKVLVDKGAHPAGERRIVLFPNALTVVDAEI